MKTKNVVWGLGILVGVLCLFAGRADLETIFAFLLIGVVPLVLLMLFRIFVEAFPLSIGLRIPYRRTLRVLLTANIVSLLVGIPVQILNGYLYSTFMPVPLAPYFRAYPVATILGSLITFVVALLVKYGVIARWCRKQQLQTGWARLLLIVFIMNAVTHSVLAPARYLITRPRHDVKTFTDDSSWAQHPLTEVYYIATNGNLCAIMTDGNGQRVIIPDTVRDYQYLPRQGLYLYLNASDMLCFFRESDKQTVEYGLPHRRGFMRYVTCSPDGQTIAFWKHRNNYRITLFNTDTAEQYSSEITATNQWSADKLPALAWGDSPDILFMKETAYQQPVIITSISVTNNIATVRQAEEQPCTLAEVYGVFFDVGHWVPFEAVSNESVKIRRTPSMFSNSIVIEQNEVSWRIADNPGLLNLTGNRNFRDVCLLENGQEFLFSDSKDGIYLVNIAERKVGQITSGGTFITLTPRYRQTFWKEEGE